MIGLDRDVVQAIDWPRAVRRILSDVSSDFILAPHFSAVYEYCQATLIDRVTAELASGRYSPGLPLTIDVPKKSGLTRPGAVPAPLDRLVYQGVVDGLIDQLEPQIDRQRVYSNRILSEDPDQGMFVAPSDCYREFQRAITEHCMQDAVTFVVKTDVACFFERIYQHRLVNLLHGYPCERRLVGVLEKLMSAFMQTDSHGIIQGVYPSDYLGNFSLVGLDTDLDVRGVQSVRFVDDIYTFHHSESAARRCLGDVCGLLRSQGLHLNEAKTRIMKAADAVYEETEIDRRFELAKQEMRNTLTRYEEYSEDDDYGFQSTWVDEIPPTETEVELHAMEDLYGLVEQEEVAPEKIERFCLPVFGLTRNPIGLNRALPGVVDRPHLAREYCRYLKVFARDNDEVRRGLEHLLTSEGNSYDWTLVWPIAALMGLPHVDPNTITVALRLVRDRNLHDGVRGLAACLVAQHGTGAQRGVLRSEYGRESSEYVRAALLYAARYFPAEERRSCLRAWSGHSTTNALVAEAVQAAVRA